MPDRTDLVLDELRAMLVRGYLTVSTFESLKTTLAATVLAEATSTEGAANWVAPAMARADNYANAMACGGCVADKREKLLAFLHGAAHGASEVCPGVQAGCAPGLAGLADWLRSQARHPCAGDANGRQWTAWAAAVEATAGVLVGDGTGEALPPLPDAAYPPGASPVPCELVDGIQGNAGPFVITPGDEIWTVSPGVPTPLDCRPTEGERCLVQYMDRWVNPQGFEILACRWRDGQWLLESNGRPLRITSHLKVRTWWPADIAGGQEARSQHVNLVCRRHEGLGMEVDLSQPHPFAECPHCTADGVNPSAGGDHG